MTENRRKYFGGIPAEERMVREMLADLRSRISSCKLFLSRQEGSDADRADIHRDIVLYKSIIKVLRKSLRAPKVKLLDRYDGISSYCCPVCRAWVRYGSYCHCCGQRLTEPLNRS